MFLNSISDFLYNDIENNVLYKNDYLLPSIAVGYILFVTWIGPSLMEARKPFTLRKVMLAYNFFEVVVNTYLFQKIFTELFNSRHIHCLPHDDPEYLAVFKRTLPLWWIVLLNKMLELLDTVFFVLRKKGNQLSGLHIMHHSAICLLCWWLIRNPSRTGFYCFIVLGINIGVHSVMYTYYGLAGLGPEMAKYLWWKKYLTALQIGQFIFDVVYVFIEFLTGCEKVGTGEIVTLGFITIMLILFLNLYRKNYNHKTAIS